MAGFCDFTTASLEVNLLGAAGVLLSDKLVLTDRPVKIRSVDCESGVSNLSSDLLFDKTEFSFFSSGFLLSVLFAAE